jgi:hypothetical protein
MATSTSATSTAPSYFQVLDFLTSGGWASFLPDPATGTATEEVSPTTHAAIMTFLHALKQRPLPLSVVIAASKYANEDCRDGGTVVIRRFKEGASSLPDKATGATKKQPPREEVRAIPLSAF